MLGKNLSLATLVVLSAAIMAVPDLPPPATAAELTTSQTAQVGSAAPEFALPDTHNKEHSLHQYKGKFVVLEWANFECPFVKKHYDSGNMQKLQKEYTGKGVVWLTVCSSATGRPGNFPADKLNELLKEKGWSATAYLQDPQGKVGKMYGAKSTPAMYVIDPKGTLIYAGAIDDKPSTDKEDIATAKNYVKAALDEALSGKAVAVASTKSYGCSVKYAD